MRLDRFAATFPKRSVASFNAKELDEWLARLSDKDEPDSLTFTRHAQHLPPRSPDALFIL
ncbi:MAG: hypothetical protein WDN28_12810 [Chthoniobacter sp.]